MKFIAVGVQRTGTNFCTQILSGLNKNHVVVRSGDRSFFWKHSMPHESGPNYSKGYETPLAAIKKNSDLNVILVSKNPLWWLSSILNRDSADLERQRSEIYRNGELCVVKALDFYREFYNSWLSLGLGKQMLHISYHEMLNNHKRQVAKINEYFESDFSGDIDLETMKVPYSKGGFNDRLSIYNNNNYDIHDDVIGLAREKISDDIGFYRSMGYFVKDES